MVECISRVDGVSRSTGVLVREEPRLDRREVVDAQTNRLAPCDLEHCRRHVYRDDLRTDASGGECERPRSGAEVDQCRSRLEAQFDETREIRARISPGLGVICGGVLGIVMLGPGVGGFVEEPIFGML
jgi:hypothetical protein